RPRARLHRGRAATQRDRQLVRMGISGGTPVAVLMERSLGGLTAVLAICKAGGVYMPLDVKAPDARLQQMLVHAQAGVLLCAEGDVRQTSLGVAGCQGLTWTPALWQDLPVSRPDTRPSAASAASVLHTSRSTGHAPRAPVHQAAL
ncbi:hypothetical protein EWW49_35640, partial [Pseudomonas syringae]